MSRSHSDSSAISVKSNGAAAKANRSVEQVAVRQQQQLLKLSFFNSPNSPMNCPSYNNTPFADSMSSEARKISQKFANSRDLSFEDLNNVSQNLVDSSLTDCDLQDMNLKILKTLPASTPSSDKIAMLQERLKTMKQEFDPVVKIEDFSPPSKFNKDDVGANLENAPKSELDCLLDKIKFLSNNGQLDEAKKHLHRLNELMGKHGGVAEVKNTLHVQPIIRQDTFDIDPETGKRKYDSNEIDAAKTESNILLEKLVELFKAQNLQPLGIGDGAGTNYVVMVPASVATPVKKPMRSFSTCSKQKPQSAMKTVDSRKHATPLKPSSVVKRLSTFTTPRPVPASKAGHPYDQKQSIQSRAGGVRKSLMMEKSPQVPKSKGTTMTPSKLLPPRNPSAAPRRSVSMKASIPAVQITKSSPPKNSAPRPSTGAPYVSTPNRRLSHMPPPASRPVTLAKSAAQIRSNEQKKGSSNVRASLAARKAVDKGSLV